MYLEQILSPRDLKTLDISTLPALCEEIRKFILEGASKYGGHIGPNLGVVELTVALHYIFDSPKDKIVFDVSHQAYVHKMLTGRKNLYDVFRDRGAKSTYQRQNESEHDFFDLGLTSTSVSLASGLAKGRDILSGDETIIAVIGDGSLSGGQAYEALNNAAVQFSSVKSRFIVIVNDNEYSIALGAGGLHNHLRALRESKGRLNNNIFKALGYSYIYLENGNNVESCIDAIKRAKAIDNPVVAHVHTIKGYGCNYIAKDPPKWHCVFTPFNAKSGEALIDKTEAGVNYAKVGAEHIDKMMEKYQEIVVIVAGNPILGKNFATRHPSRYIDVSIAEANAVSFASGIAKYGAKPFVFIEGAFIQRAYSQLLIDLALNKNPAVIVLHGSGIILQDSTHYGIFDIPLISHIPNLVCISPTCETEYKTMLDWAYKQQFPIVIRLSRDDNDFRDGSGVMIAPIELNRYEIIQYGKDVAIIGLGIFSAIAKDASDILEDYGIRATLINPRFYSELDIETLTKIAKEHYLVVTIENGIREGGWGERVAAFYARYEAHNHAPLVLNLGANKEFVDWIPFAELLKRYELTPKQIAEKILAITQKHKKTAQNFALREAEIRGVYYGRVQYSQDDRGSYTKLFSSAFLRQFGLSFEPKEIACVTAKAGIKRGFHFDGDNPPKVAYCLTGKVMAVVVDLRADSDTIGQLQTFELSGLSQTLLFIPDGVTLGTFTVEDSLLVYASGRDYGANRGFGGGGAPPPAPRPAAAPAPR
ncbi:MAG: 1-deoxy-D-xylulose-5-phosphate synthase, partial [Helicobacteraceae bacterium]|nr:1-deoxy-D-xylulose-5-phosphate synthase [Helicobacteraceae bacterium]